MKKGREPNTMTLRRILKNTPLLVGVVVGVIVLTSLLGIVLFPDAVKVYSPILILLGLGLILYGATR